MTTPGAYAKDATAALHKVLRISPNDFDADGAAAVIEKAIRNATRERERRSRRQLREAKAAADERLARLLSSSPAVIYSFNASGDFAPTFVSDNIGTVFGYTRAEYLENPSFWRTGFIPTILPASRKRSPNFSTTEFNPWSTAFAAATVPIVG